MTVRRVSVLVPSYGRPANLEACLSALERQDRLPDEVVVVVRASDHQTRDVASAHGRLVRIVEVEEPGLVAALNRGIDVAEGDWIALTDDDAVPWPDWLAQLEAILWSDSSIAGVGGRDHLPVPGTLGRVKEASIGRLRWYGDVVGFHHLGFRPARDVDVLKGVNCAYRARVLKQQKIDTRLRGSGAQMHSELHLGLALRRQGYRLIYDPLIGVDHYHAERPASDLRHSNQRAQIIDAVHNETLAVLEYLPPLRRIAFVLWAILVGTRATPAPLQGLRLIIRDHAPVAVVLPKVYSVLVGRFMGLRAWQRRLVT